MIFNQLRRATADAMNATGMQAGMPKMRVYASEVQQLLERYDRLEEENAKVCADNDVLRSAYAYTCSCRMTYDEEVIAECGYHAEKSAENARLRHELAYAAKAVASLPHVESLCMTDSTLSIAAGLRKALNPTSAGDE